MSAPPWLRYSDDVRRGSIGLVVVVAGCFGNPIEEMTGSIGTAPTGGDATSTTSTTTDAADESGASTAGGASMTDTSAATLPPADGSDSGDVTTGDATTGDATTESTGEAAETTTGDPPQDICADVGAACPCIANSCCSEIQACVQFAECDAVAQCVIAGGTPKSCVGGDIPEGGESLAQCAYFSCGGGC